ncbi:MAG: hypothetical protein GF398_02860 [Chitinivibrionales bacterium]|nr:hypothetical protein [Chitinivibrionales bacterium]
MNHPVNHPVLFAAALLLLMMASARGNPILSGFGSPGAYATQIDSVPVNSRFNTSVYILSPAPVPKDTMLPAVIFAHGIGANHPRFYRALLDYIVSKGIVVIYPTYPAGVAGVSTETAYALIRADVLAGIRHVGDRIDTTRLGFVGHSYGGGAIPWLAHTCLTEMKWGSHASFLYIMAPWYSYRISSDELRDFPKHPYLIMQIFESDMINDQRMAKDIYDNIGIPADRKNYIILHDTYSPACTLLADHGVPADSTVATCNNLDFYGLFRLFDALQSLSLNGEASAHEIAMGRGTKRQILMGKCKDDTPVHPLTATKIAHILHPQTEYLNFWDHRNNPRAGYYSHYGALRPYRYERRKTLRNYYNLTVKFTRTYEGRRAFRKKQLADPGNDTLPVPQPATGYGAPGIYKVTERYFPHHDMGDGYIHIYAPKAIDTPLPVLLFMHGYSRPTPDHYRRLLNFCASKGYMVIFSSYHERGFRLTNRKHYDLLLKGFEEALLLESRRIDTTRIGFIGHSFGAGAAPALARHFLVKRRWGANGACMFLMAPWYVRYITNEQFNRFPRHLNAIVQVYENEKINDWRMAEDIFYSLPSPPSRKDFIILHNDEYGQHRLSASHTTALSEGSRNTNALDYYGIFKPLDALCAFTFKADSAARPYSLGNGSHKQIYMGAWPDGTPVKHMTVTDHPASFHPQKAFLFRWGSLINKRRKMYRPR